MENSSQLHLSRRLGRPQNWPGHADGKDRNPTSAGTVILDVLLTVTLCNKAFRPHIITYYILGGWVVGWTDKRMYENENTVCTVVVRTYTSASAYCTLTYCQVWCFLGTGHSHHCGIWSFHLLLLCVGATTPKFITHFPIIKWNNYVRAFWQQSLWKELPSEMWCGRSYWRFKRTYCLNLQGWRLNQAITKQAALKMEAAHSSKVSVIYQTTQCYIPEDCTLQAEQMIVTWHYKFYTQNTTVDDFNRAEVYELTEHKVSPGETVNIIPGSYYVKSQKIKEKQLQLKSPI